MASGVPKNAFAHWMTPLQAVQHLDSVFGTDSRSYTSKHTLLERLRGDMVKAVAGHSTQDGNNRTELTEIHPDEWHHVQEDQIFWTSGDLTYRAREYGTGETRAVRHFDVRFEPEAVRAIAAPAAKAKNESQAATASDKLVEETQKGPPVSDAHLKAWYALFRQTHQGSADTLENAYKSAAGMFPGKFVSRQKVRDLAGGRKRGRKLGSED